MCNTLYAMLNLFIIESVVCFVNGELEGRMELRYGHVVHRQRCFLAWMYVVVTGDSFPCSIRSVGHCRQSTIHQDLSLWTSSFANSADIAQP